MPLLLKLFYNLTSNNGEVFSLVLCSDCFCLHVLHISHQPAKYRDERVLGYRSVLHSVLKKRVHHTGYATNEGEQSTRELTGERILLDAEPLRLWHP